MVSNDSGREIDDWDSYYKENKVEEMPWYEKELDLDLEKEIKSRNMSSGKFLDIGTGPGTQAIQLSKLGFESTGADISKHAIEKANKLSEKVNFIVDDILESSFPDNEFDFILDRGCFHVFDESLREKYLSQIKRILKNDGILFLKVMSKDDTTLSEGRGPNKFSEQEVLDAFENNFVVNDIRSTVYYCRMNPLPKAIFAVIKQKNNNEISK